MDDITMHTTKGEHFEGEDLDLICPCGREDFQTEEVTMCGSIGTDQYMYILCAGCDRLIRAEGNDKEGHKRIFIGEPGSGTAYTKSRMGEDEDV